MVYNVACQGVFCCEVQKTRWSQNDQKERKEFQMKDIKKQQNIKNLT